MRWSQLASVVLGGTLLLLGAASCRSSTEITLEIRTNEPCAKVKTWQGVAVYVGKPGGESGDQAPTLVTNHCEGEGYIGSLVIVPSGAKDELVGVRVVAGIEQSPEACVASGYEGGCIVARRELRFMPHADLSLDVALLRSCLNVGCDPRNTCVAGDCQAAAAPEAPPVDVAPVDTPPVDQPAPGEPSVRCGDDGVFCPLSGNVCCLTVDVDACRTHGACMPADRCREIVLSCDDDEDCPNGGDSDAWEGICVLIHESNASDPFIPTKITHSHCMIAVRGQGGLMQPTGLALCENHLGCADQQFVCRASRGNPNRLPGYNWCELTFP